MSGSTKVLVIGDDNSVTKTIVAKLQSHSINIAIAEAHEAGVKCQEALVQLGMSAQEAAQAIRTFEMVARNDPINFRVTRQPAWPVVNIKADAPKPWERESWRRKKKGRT